MIPARVRKRLRGGGGGGVFKVASMGEQMPF